MAEKETQSKAAVYRSVSFKKLHNWKANKSGPGSEDQRHGSEDLETGGALPPPAAQPTDMRSSAVARKVSKISAASLSRAELKKGSTHTISPSIRQLSEKFGTSTNSSSTLALQAAVSHRIRSPDGSSSQDISGCFPEQSKDLSGTLTDKLSDQKCQESVSGSDSDRGHKRRVRKIGGGTTAGKSDYSEISDGSYSSNTLNSEDDICVLGISACKSHHSHRSCKGETIHVDSSWPSVTKIRELFGDGHRKKHKSLSDGEELKSDDYHLHHSYSTKDSNTSSDKSDRQSPLHPRAHWQDTNSSDHDANRHQCMDSNTEEHFHDGDFSSVTRKLSTDSSRIKTHKSRTKGWIDGDLRPTPPTPPPRSSSVALPLSSHPCAYSEQGQRHRAKQPQSSDSLHSSHSSSKPQTGSSVEPVGTRERLSSGEEEDDSGGQTGRKTHSFVHSSEEIGTHISRNKHDAWAKLSHRSSGSEDDSPAGLAHQVRRRSLRKKKKSNCSRENEESDDSDNQHMMMEHLERHQHSCDSQMEGRRLDSLRSKGCLNGQMWEKGHTARGSSVVQDSYRCLCKASEGQVGTSSVPFVSRVSKVTIPSFLSTPLGSRSSSRYSSTETLKAEDLVSSSSSRSSSSVLSKTYHGNATMYRSPSFGHGDNFSHASVRVRHRLVPSLNQGEGIPNAAENSLGHRSVSHEKDKDRISMSNPDIASDTLSLLSYLKTDLSELRMKKRGQDGEENLNSGFQGVQSTSAMYRMGSRTSGLNSRRPSLKDLTATLRRTKSFTYSEKPLGSAMRSSSEQRLDCESDGDRIVISDREVESDDCRGYDYEEPMPTPLQDRYIQEARQVIRDICQMSASKDYDDDQDDIARFKRNGNFHVVEENKESNKTKQVEGMDGQIVDTVNKKQSVGESGTCLPRGNSEENMFGDKSLDELSGHESSLTDEGIVTEPEAGSYGGLSSGTDLLGQTLTVWTQSGLYEEQSPDMMSEKSLSTTAPSVRTEYEAVAIGGDVSISKNINQASLEAPPTPGALRRRRKFSSAANNGSDSSNGSNGESNGESAYRSLSDPMPHRSRSVADDGSNSFSMDSNLLGSLSLNSKVGISADSSAANLSECTGSAASDLSVYNDSLRDYSTVIQSIMHEPGAMDKLIDEKANGKVVKKKSFSDPSRRGELASPALEVQKHPNETINELEQPIPPSSSEPILSEQRNALWEMNSEQYQLYSNRSSQSQSEHVLPCHVDRNGVNKVGNEEPKLPFDPKLAQMLSPCISRRGYKKRTHRVTHQQSYDDGDQLEEQQEDQTYEDHMDTSKSILPQLPVAKIRPKHVRHASEPATFVPISPSNQQQSSFKSQDPQQISGHRQGEGTPSLEDVTEQYILALNPPEGSSDACADGAVMEGTSSVPATAAIDPKLQRKSSDELAQAPLKTKPRVVGDMFSV